MSAAAGGAAADGAARAAEAKRRRGWLDAAELAAARDDDARRRLLADVRVVMATFANAEEAPTLAVVRLAQAEGVPVVAVERPGVREAVRHGETGYVSGFYDENHLRAAVAKLCRDDVLWLRMRAALGR